MNQVVLSGHPVKVDSDDLLAESCLEIAVLASLKTHTIRPFEELISSQIAV